MKIRQQSGNFIMFLWFAVSLWKIFKRRAGEKEGGSIDLDNLKEGETICVGADGNGNPIYIRKEKYEEGMEQDL